MTRAVNYISTQNVIPAPVTYTPLGYAQSVLGAGVVNTPTNISAGAQRAAGAATVTLTYSVTGAGGSTNTVSVGVDILAFTGGGATCPMTRSLMGVGC